MRSEFPAKVKSAAYDRCGGRCECCGTKLRPGKFAYDHIVPDALDGEPTLENCQVLCDNCHGAKTGGRDVPQIAKGKRQRAFHIGAKAKSSRGFRKAPRQHRASTPVAAKFPGDVMSRSTPTDEASA